MEFLMWFCIGGLIGLVILFYLFVVWIVFYIAFALFDALCIENPFMIIWDMITGQGV